VRLFKLPEGGTPCNIALLDHSGKSITNVDRAHQLMLSFIEANRKPD